MVSVKLASGARLATLVAGMTVGEMTLLETYRSADVWADTRVDCLELSLDAYGRFREGIRKPASASSAISLPCWPASRSSPIGRSIRWRSTDPEGAPLTSAVRKR
jgi:hypothetical protein